MRALLLEKLGSGIRKASGDPTREELPDRMKTLLIQLDETEADCGHQQAAARVRKRS